MRIFRPVLFVSFLAIASGFAFAETVEEFEARQRGVPVEVVQLENAKARIATLEKQVAELTAKNAALEKKLAAGPATMLATTQTTATHPAPSPEIATAIKEHRLVKGMTVAQMKSAIEGIWSVGSDRDSVQTWECKWWEAGTGTQIVVASAEMSNGVIVSCETKTNTMETETAFGNGPYAAKKPPPKSVK